jgi:hypothetical protein
VTANGFGSANTKFTHKRSSKMKTLRLLRNAAAMFIIATALLLLRPGVQPLHAARSWYCLYKPGYNGCTFDSNGNCSDTKCVPPYCADMGCTKPSRTGF